MSRFFRLPLVLLVVATAISTGCRTYGPSRSAVASAARSDAELERRARAHAHYAAAVIHDMNDETALALEQYYQAALDDPANETLILDVTRRLLLNKQTDKAMQVLRAAAKNPDASGVVFARLGLVYSASGMNKEAIAANRTAIEKSPDHLAGYQNLFQTYIALGQDPDALAVLGRAAKRKDAGTEFLIGLAELYAGYAAQFPSQREKIVPKAVAIGERVEKLEPASTGLLLRLGDAFYAMDQPEKAAKAYERSLESVGGLPLPSFRVGQLPLLRDTVRSRLAEIYLDARDYPRAKEKLEQILGDDPSNARANFFLGSIAYDEKRWADAAQHFEKTVMFSAGFEQGYYSLASAQLAADQESAALVTLEAARRRFPQSFLMEYLLGMAFSQSKAYPEALQHFTAAEIQARAGDTNQLTESFYFQYGAACERNKNYIEAEQHFRKAIALAPKFAPALNYLGYMWADRGENLEEARELIQRALEVEPDSAAYLDSMGWVLFKLGKPQPALEYIHKAIEKNEEPDAELYHHLGDIYSALNQPDKARDAWQKSIAVEPNEAVQKKLGESATE